MFLHIDIDSFFASAERSVNPKLKGLPICVGSRSNLEIFNKKRTYIKLMNNNSGAFVTPVFYTKKHPKGISSQAQGKNTFENYFVDEIEGRKKIRGIVTTASYEARAKGVKTAMPIAQALQLCPEMIVIPSNYPLYHTLSYKMHAFMQAHIPKVEQYSIDEFFGDLEGWVKDEDVYDFATSLQDKILTHFDIPVSIGISHAKWISKLATESAKPYGVYAVKDIDRYIENIPIAKFPGIGSGYQKRLSERYIRTLGEVKRNKALLYSWHKPGIQLYKRITGTCNEKIDIKGDRKSIGISRTFDAIDDSNEIRRRISIMARHVVYIVMSLGVNPTTFYLKINYEHGIKVKKNQTVNRVFSEHLMKNVLYEMYEALCLLNKGAIKLSLNVSNFTSQHQKTFSLLSLDKDIKEYELSVTIQNLRDRFGLDILKTADEL
ncbi:MAG TPA: DNA polymerase IV [Sulfurovum sp.]|nr:DNA polymerase IV [Sulfurovum sp.]